MSAPPVRALSRCVRGACVGALADDVTTLPLPALVGFAAGAAMTLAIVAAPAPAAVSAALASAGPISLAAAAPPLVAGGVALAAVEELLFRGFLADEVRTTLPRASPRDAHARASLRLALTGRPAHTASRRPRASSVSAWAPSPSPRSSLWRTSAHARRSASPCSRWRSPA